jgi:hypothetical protein
MSDTVKKALDLVSGYQDPASPKMKDWNWRPLRDVQESLGGLPEIPSHVERFGAFMDETARRAAKGGLTPRDLIKAYAITRSSIQRRAQTADKVRQAGLDLPPSVTGMIRPEGAMGEWLHSPMGQRYLDAAERGKVDDEAVAHAQQVMKPFGLNAEMDALPWAVQNLGPRHKEVSDLVARALKKNSSPEEWRNFSKDLRGIGTAKSGFVASMMGRGDQPTLDARQVILQTGMPTSEAKKPMAKAGYEAVDRLAARQTALNPKMDSGLEPFRQHLTHHAIWDKAGNEETTHDDVMNAMRNAKDGGRIGYADGGGTPGGIFPEQSIEDHPMVKATLDAIHGGANQQMVRAALEAAKTSGFTRTGAGLMQRDPRLMEAQPKLTDVKPTPKSAHLVTPFSELQAEFSPKNNLSPQKYADIERMQREGAYIRPFVGDKTPADTVLLGHHGTRLVEPVDQQGGGDYMRSEFSRTNQPTGWRSREGASKSMQKRVGKGVPEGSPVYGAHMLMGDVAGDSSHMLLHAAINQVPNLPIAQKHIEAFDEEMRKKFPHDDKYPMPWPGIMNTQAVHNFFYNQPTVVKGKKGQPDTLRPQPRPGQHVSDFVKNMDSVRWQAAGFPSIASARFASIHPDLMAEPQGAVGYGLTRLDPNGQLVANDETRAHGTYTHGIPTLGYAGRFKALVPADKLFEEHVRNAKNPTQVQQTLMTKFPAVEVNQRVVDLVKGAEEERMKRYGFNTGGAVKAPTEAQKQAGNYQKGHISFQGLPISIENPKGSTRSGKGPDGKEWSVKMPYDYGYIKRTQGADGDHVDVCIGPDHTSDHVFLVDQHDHRTKQFDEHKVMLGYRTKEAAMAAYCGGFSDGKGPERMKTMVRLSMPEFKTWLKKHDTKRAVRGQGHIDRALSMTSVYTVPNDRDAG